MVDWGTVNDVFNVLSVVVVVILLPLLVLYLKKYFPTREEIAKDYVANEKFVNEMHQLRTDLQTQLGNAAANTDKLLQRGIRGIRREINGMGERIERVNDKATGAEAVSKNTLELLARVESDSGEFRSEVRNMSAEVQQLGKDVGYIKGILEEQKRKRDQ